MGTVKLGSGAFEGPYDWRSRSADGHGTNPEELIGAAHAGCFSMALAAQLADAGTPAALIRTTARVRLEKVEQGFAITEIDLHTEAEVPGIEASAFQTLAEGAKANCPVSKALTGTVIRLQASLL
jgi:osmotically inducible protein OsmC